VEPGPGKVLSRLVKRIVARRELAHVR
jgi:hypothetical protein